MSSPGWSEAVDGRDSGAIFSPCRQWRYLLFRRWDAGKGTCMFVGLNPSTADESKDDPTIRRCMRFARDWGYGAVWMTNVFALRATDPRVMRVAGAAALGPQNNQYLLECARAADIVVAAWGVHGLHRDRQKEVVDMLCAADVTLYALGVTQGGCPRHPLYLSSELKPEPWASGYKGVPVRVIDGGAATA